jgi:molybdate-binding protein/DNA-binding XRE family transcriptional regulator
MQIRNDLKALRERRGHSASALAREVGVSRQTIYAMEAGTYVPNTAIALQLARALEVTVEDLFQLAADPPSAPRVHAELLAPPGSAFAGQPVQVAAVGSHTVAVPVSAQPLYLPEADGVLAERPRAAEPASVQPLGSSESQPRLVVAGCDPGISVLAHQLRDAGPVELIAAPCSSRQALEWLKHGLVHVAGSHLKDAESGEYNLAAVRALFPKGGVRVVTFASWEQGLVTARGNPKGIHAVADLASKHVSIVNREPGAGSRELLEREMLAAGLSKRAVRGYDRVAPGHLPAAWLVASGEADCCIATRAAARVFGLHFEPLAVERYDLVVLRRHESLPAVKAMLEQLNRSALRRRLEMFAGYDTSQMGAVRA